MGKFVPYNKKMTQSVTTMQRSGSELEYIDYTTKKRDRNKSGLSATIPSQPNKATCSEKLMLRLALAVGVHDVLRGKNGFVILKVRVGFAVLIIGVDVRQNLVE